jgi:hypothetical protein
VQTLKDAYGEVASLFGDPEEDTLTPGYFIPLANTAYQWALQYLKGSCSPYIEKVVIVEGVSVDGDENSLTPSNQNATQTYPLKYLITPKWVDYKLSGTTNKWRRAREYAILPDSAYSLPGNTYDIRVRGDFMRAPLTSMDSVLEIYPNCAHALAMSIMALIGLERPNQAWADMYQPMALQAWQEIYADLVRQQQRLSWRLGSPNRVDRRGTYYNLPQAPLQGTLGWEWRSFIMYVKLT